MESINLGAVLFALLLLLWVAYALPRTASRRDVMGRARSADLTAASPGARDLSEAVRSRRPSPEVSATMSQDRLLLRPADPTSRPRFDAAPGVRIDPVEERARSRRALRVLLVALSLGTLALVAAALAQLVAWWVPLLAVAGLGAYLLGLRRAELERRSRIRRAASIARQDDAEERAAAAQREDRERSAPGASTPSGAAAAHAAAERAPLEETTARAADQVSRPGEWTPRPVPRPTYALRGEVEDLASRHAAHRASIGATTVPLEADGVEEREAAEENYAPAADLHLDEILARRRA